MARGKSRGKDRHGPGRVDEESGGGEAWLTTYADAITLLMAFFMMLYAMSQIDQVKFEGLIAGFAEPFGNDSVGANSDRDDLLEGGAGIVGDATTALPGLASGPRDAAVTDPFASLLSSFGQPTTAPRGSTTPRANAEGVPFLDLDQLATVRDAIAVALASQGLGDAAVYDLTERGLAVSIAADDVLFDSGSTRMQAAGMEVIAGIAPVIADFANEVRVEGHTDDRPLGRGAYTNWNLSTDRAIAIVDQLVGRHGLDPRRLSASGFGEFRPVVPNTSPTARARNRRVEIVILAGGS